MSGVVKKKVDVQLPLLTEQLKTLAVFVQILKNRKLLNSNIMRLMVFCQRALRSKNASNMSQGEK